MQTQSRTIALSLALIVALGTPSPEGVPAKTGAEATIVEAGSLQPIVAVHDATPRQAELVDWAVEQFAAAGLALPPLDITFHDGRAGCHGYQGLFNKVGKVGYLDVCVHTRHLLLHELTHAWESLGNYADARESFMEFWGLETWDDRTTAWEDRGSERAAETVALVLDGVPSNPSESMQRYLCGYQLLTGEAAPDDGCSDLAISST